MNLPAKVAGQNNKIPSVSLVICAKNELENLKKHLSGWLEQNGINYELILVNDASNDGSKEWLDKASATCPYLKVIHLESHEDSLLKGKRKALQIGVEAAHFDYVVFTDADCTPHSNDWLRTMADSFGPKTEIVLGFSPYRKQSGILNLLIRYETLLTALQYLSFARIGLPYMGVGRNIAYKKAILSEAAFLESNQTTSGDDDLLVAKLATNENVVVQTNQESFVYSIPVNNFSAWLKQKQRHYSTAKYYSWPRKLAVGGFGALNLLFYIAMFTLLFTEFGLLSVLSLYLLKNATFVILNYKSIRNFKEFGILKNILYLDFVFLILLIFNHLKALRVKYGWN